MATKTILIVDDAAETRIFLKGIINSLGFSFYEAKSGMEALKILNDHVIDLVILDILMPNFDGYQTLEFINKLKQKQNIKVVFLTGKKGELDQAKINELKPDDLIHKTVDIQVLKTKLKKLLESSSTTATPASQSSSKLELSAKITNMPLDFEVKISKITQSGITFSSQFNFKEGAMLSLDCPRAAQALKKTGELQVKVLKSVQEQNLFIVQTVLV